MTIGKRIRPDGRARAKSHHGGGKGEGRREDGRKLFVPSSIIYATIDAAVEFLPQFHEMLMGCGIRSRSRLLAHSIRARTVDPSLALELELESWHSMTTTARRRTLTS